MADLGSIGRQSLEAYSKTTRQWTDATKSIRALMFGVAGFGYKNSPTTVTGTVAQNGVKVSRLVRIYRRDTGELLASATSDSGDGSFSAQLNGYTGLVFVIAFDDTGTSPDFNAAIYDLVEPT